MGNKELREELYLSAVNEIRTEYKYKFNKYSTLYLDDNYKDELISSMKKNHVYDCFKNEFVEMGCGKTKICKITSSKRLCYSYFANHYSIGYNKCRYSFEDFSFKFLSDKKEEVFTKFSLVFENKFYLSKCEQFFYEKNYIKASNYKNIIKQMFNIKDDILEKDDILYLSLKQIGIDRDGSIYDLKFDFKELLNCLLALANRNIYKDEKVYLTYLWFIPPMKSEEFNKFFNDIMIDFCDIDKSVVINTFLTKYNINSIDIIPIPFSHHLYDLGGKMRI